MTKDNILEAAGCVGKTAIRGVAWIGTNLAFAGGGVLASLIWASKVKNVGLKTAIYAAGVGSSCLAAYFAADAVDNHLKEEYDLDI